MEPLFLTATLNLAEGEGDQLPRKFSGVAYSGDRVSRFNAVIDLATLRTAEGMPLLQSHDHDIVIGTIAETQNDQRALNVGGEIFSDTDDAAKDIVLKAKRGVKYQMSVGIFDSNEEFIKAGAKVTVNGREFIGPLMVLRNAYVREVSIVTLGADDQTQAKFFSARSPQPMQTPEQQQARIAELEGQVTTLTAENTALKADKAALQGQIEASAKAVRTEKVKQLFADTGRQFSDADAAGYLAMTDEQFDGVAKDMRALKAKLPEHLFSGTQVPGSQPANEGVLMTAVNSRFGLK